MGNNLLKMVDDEQQLLVVISNGENTWNIDLSVLRNELSIEVSEHDYYGKDPHAGWSIPLPSTKPEGDLHTLYGATCHTHKTLLQEGK